MKYSIFALFAPILITPQQLFAQGLVTCSGLDCDACQLAAMTNNIISWLFGFMAIVAVLVLAYAGFRLATSGGDVTTMQWAKGRFVAVFIGFLLMLASWLIVDTILKGLTNDNQGLEVWGTFEVDQCGSQRTPESVEYDAFIPEDRDAIVASNPGAYNLGLSATCNPSTPDFPNCAVSIATNDNMNPIFDCNSGGCSGSVRSGAAERMQETLNGPFALLQSNFGSQLIINDTIAKAGTSREGSTPNSRHFYGDALDISLAGMSNSDRIRLVREAKRAGFTGFGLGNNILHIDRGAPRAWAYGNNTYGGQNVSGLISELRN